MILNARATAGIDDAAIANGRIRGINIDRFQSRAGESEAVKRRGVVNRTVMAVNGENVGLADGGREDGRMIGETPAGSTTLSVPMNPP